jgi:4-hydroxy-tetrahydrodipicolinate synthase
MTDHRFRGSYTVTVTPFLEGGEGVDLPAFKHFVDWQLNSGVPGLIILGTTGEFLTIADDERTAIIETIVDHVDGRVPVLVGSGSADTRKAVAYSREAEKLGAQGLMVCPPYYYTPTQDEIYKYYATICDATDLPIMVYNNPVTTNVDIPASLVAKMTRDMPNIRYIKEASLDVARVYDIVEQTDGLMNVFAGERVVESFLLGAVGYVNPYGNYLPYATSRIWDLLTEGHLEDAKAIERLVHKFDAIIAEGHPTYGHQCYSKALAAQVGYPVGDVRPPLTTFRELGSEGIRRRDRIMKVITELNDLMASIDAKAA